MSDTVIRNGGSRPWQLRWLEAVATILLWVGYIYLLREVFVVVARFLEGLISGATTTQSGGATAVATSLGSYGEVIVVNSAVFIGWALYNQFMYGHRHRRRSSDPVPVEDIGKFFRMTPEQVRECRQSRRILVMHDRFGAIAGYDAGD